MPVSMASSCSRSRCSRVVPATSREDVAPVPHSDAASAAASASPRVRGEAKIVVAGQIDELFVSGAGERAADQAPAVPDGGLLLEPRVIEAAHAAPSATSCRDALMDFGDGRRSCLR